MKQREVSLKAAQRKHYISVLRKAGFKRPEICEILGISSSMLHKIDHRVYKNFGFTQEEILNYEVKDMWKGESGVEHHRESMPTVQ